MKRILPPAFFLFCTALMVITQVALAQVQIVSWPLSAFGIVPLFIGLGIASAGARLFKNVGTNIRTFDDPDVLVTTGLFAQSRNPMYLGLAIAAFGVAILCGGAVAFAIALGHLVVLDRWYIAFEEQRMTQQFGDRYQTYKRQVRRWI